MCNVVVSFDLMKNCENDRILKTYEILGNIEGVQIVDQFDKKLSKLQTFVNS